LQNCSTPGAQLEGEFHVGDAEMQCHRLQRFSFLVRTTCPRCDVTVTCGINHRLRAYGDESRLVAQDHRVDAIPIGDDIGDLRVGQGVHAGIDEYLVCGALEALRIAARNQPVRMFFDFGEITVDVEGDSGTGPRGDDSHSFEHLEDETPDDRTPCFLEDEAVEGRADDAGKESSCKTHAVQDPHRSPLAGGGHRCTETGQTRATDQHIRFGDDWDRLRIVRLYAWGKHIVPRSPGTALAASSGAMLQGTRSSRGRILSGTGDEFVRCIVE